jgi:hypothetical protein
MKTLKEKIEIIKQVKNVLGRNSVSFELSEIVKTLSIDEVLSSEFEENLLSEFNMRDQTPASRFISFLEDYHTKYSFRDISEGSKEKIIDKYIKLASKNDNIKINTRDFKLLENKEDYFIASILKSKSFNVMMKSSSGDINRLLDNTMVNSDSETIMSLFDHLTKTNFDYTNYPLVILNSNLDQEQKISIIKQTYKQKDLNKYTMFMKEKLVDLNDLDSFIEATIIRNNRVKEKSNSVVDLLRRVFIGIRGNNSSINFENYQNSKTFFKKYREYFTKSVIEYLTSDNSYYINRNTVSFLSEVFRDATFDEKIKVSMINREVGDRLFSESKEIPLDVAGNEEKERAYLEYIVKRNSIEVLISNFGIEKTAEFINKYDNLVKYISKKFYIDGKSSFYDDNIDEKTLEFYKLLSDNVLKNVDFNPTNPSSNSKEIYKYFGLGISERNRYDAAKNFGGFNTLILNIFKIFKSSEYSSVLKETLYEKYIAIFEDEDFVNSDLLQHLSSLFSGKDGKEIISTLKSRSNVSIQNDFEIFQKILFSNVLTFLETNFPEKYEIVKDNFQRLENNLRIIVNI